MIAESFERIHRSNLLMMGILPLQFAPGESRSRSASPAAEIFAIEGLAGGDAREVLVTATPDGGGEPVGFPARVRLDTPRERDYFRHGGILPFVLRRLLPRGGTLASPTGPLLG